MGDMSIGVTDYEQQKYSRRSYGSDNAMCYYGRDGYKYPDDYEGSGFKQGDVVEVEVDRTTRTIKYIVNGTV